MSRRDEEVDDVYSGNYSESSAESDEIDEAEEGFMRGYNEEEVLNECANCKTTLDDDFLEEDHGNKTYKFCSKKCARIFNDY